MGVPFGICSFFIGLWGLFSALPAHGRGDTFHVAPTRGDNLGTDRHAPDDILTVNEGLILPEAPESSFLVEGDILKDRLFKLFSSSNPRWPKNDGIVQIPYVISSQYDNSSVKMIKEALEDFGRLTCAKFTPYSYQRDFVSIAPLSGCFSSVGRVGGMQLVSLAPACLRRGKGVALHQLMHVLGFWHEHARADRDKYVRISWDEVFTGFEINFRKSWNANMLVDYDYSSVMHYARNAFSTTGLPTMIPLSASEVLLGHRGNLSRADIARVNKLYGCRQETPPEGLPSKHLMPKELEAGTTGGKVKFPAAWHPTLFSRETPATAMPSSRNVGKDFGATEAPTRSTQDHHMVPAPTPEKKGGSQDILSAPGKLQHKTQPRGMETKVTGTARTPEMGLPPFLGTSPEVLPSEVVPSSSARPTPDVRWSLSKARPAFTGRNRGPLTAMGTRSAASEKGDGLPNPASAAHLQASWRQTSSITGNRTGSPVRPHLMGDTQTTAAKGLKTEAAASGVVGSEETLGGGEAGSLMRFAIHQGEGVTAEIRAESFSPREGTVLPSVGPSSPVPRSAATLLEPGPLITKQPLVPGSPEAPEDTAGTPSSWAAAPGRWAESRPKQAASWERSSTEGSTRGKQFPPLPAWLARRGSRWRFLATNAPPPGSTVVPGTEAQMATEAHTLTRPELPNGTATLPPTAGGAQPQSWAVRPPQGSSPRSTQAPGTTEPKHKATPLQRSSALSYGPRGFLTGRPASAEVQGQRRRPTTEMMPITTELIKSSREDTGVGLPGEAKTSRRTTLWLLFHSQRLGSQVPVRPEEGVTEPQQQPSPPLLAGVGPTAAQTSETEMKSPPGQGMEAPQRHCEGELGDWLPEARPSRLKHTTKRLASLARQSKSRATSQRSPKTESKKPDLSAEGKPGSEENPGMSLSCRDVVERNRIITNIQHSEKETLSSGVSKPVATVTHGRAPYNNK